MRSHGHTCSIPREDDEDEHDLAALPAPAEEQPRGYLLPSAVRQIVNEMADFSLLADANMRVLCAANVFAMLGFYAPFVYIGARSVANGQDGSVTADDGALLLSFIGVSNTLGRVFFGWLADRRWFTSLNITSSCLLVCATANLTLIITTSYASAAIYGVVFGFAISSVTALTSVVLVEQVGLERLTNAFGLICVFRGVACMIGSPLAGLVFDLTGTYDASFALSAALFGIAGLIGTVLNVRQYRQRRDDREKDRTLKDALDGVDARKLVIVRIFSFTIFSCPRATTRRRHSSRCRRCTKRPCRSSTRRKSRGTASTVTATGATMTTNSRPASSTNWPSTIRPCEHKLGSTDGE